MKTVIIFVGIQANGKTTFYNKYFTNDFIHINLDTQRTRAREKALLEECFSCESSFVVDNTNPTRANRERYIVPARKAGYHIIGYYFRSSVAESIERNMKRSNSVPVTAIACTSNKLELPHFDEGFDELYYVTIADDDSFKVEEWRMTNDF